MFSTVQLTTVLEDWRTVLGEQPTVGVEDPGRELWPVTASDGRRFFLKRLGPWRNLPVADEARVLRYLSAQGVGVAEFLITDRARVFAGRIEDAFVLIARLDSDHLQPDAVAEVEEAVGHAVAELHLALAGYPWPANSYTERLCESLTEDLLLPADLAESFALRRDEIMAALAALPVQLVHGDLTPANVLVRAPGVVSGFIDFDHLPLAPRVWDIARYLSRRARLRWRGGSPGTSSRLDSIGGFLRGYQRTSPLSDAEVAAIPAGILAGQILEASYGQQISSGLLHRRRFPDHDEELRDTVEAARWLVRNVDTVTAAVRAGVG